MRPCNFNVLIREHFRKETNIYVCYCRMLILFLTYLSMNSLLKCYTSTLKKLFSEVLHHHLNKYKELFRLALNQASFLDRALALRLEQEAENVQSKLLSCPEHNGYGLRATDSVSISH